MLLIESFMYWLNWDHWSDCVIHTWGFNMEKKHIYKLQQFLLCGQHTKRSGQCHYYEKKYKYYSLTNSLRASIIKFQYWCAHAHILLLGLNVKQALPKFQSLGFRLYNALKVDTICTSLEACNLERSLNLTSSIHVWNRSTSSNTSIIYIQCITGYLRISLNGNVFCVKFHRLS